MPTEILADPAQEPLDENQKLWRYMKLSTLLLLLKGTAFFPSVATLRTGDLLEGVSSLDPTWTLHALDELQGREAARELYAWLKSNAAPWEREMLDDAATAGPGNNTLWGNWYARELAKRRGIWCWFASLIESAAMWPIYGPHGIAVSTSVGALVRALPAKRHFQIARIRYINPHPYSTISLNPESERDKHLIHRPHLLKRGEYEHEKEVRVVTTCDGDAPGVLIKSIDWNGFVQEIVISPLVPHDEAEAINEVLWNWSWLTKPEVRRSSLLGDKAARDASFASMRVNWNDFFGEEEQGLPHLLTIL